MQAAAAAACDYGASIAGNLNIECSVERRLSVADRKLYGAAVAALPPRVVLDNNCNSMTNRKLQQQQFVRCIVGVVVIINCGL
jgi:hypothetical protein